MSEEMKCPCCGSDIYVAVSENTGASLRMCLKCELVCPLVCLPLIAAAMELAKAESWEEETDDVRAYLDGILEDCDAWDEIVNTNISAERAVFDARDRVLEVFK